MITTADVYSHERTTFAERVAALAGQTAYRVPVGGRATAGGLTEQDIAAALAFARRGPWDIGPDVAVSMICQNDYRADRVIAQTTRQLLADGGHLIRNLRHLAPDIAAQAYRRVVWLAQPVPAGGRDEWRWLRLWAGAAAWLTEQASTAIARAEERYYRADLPDER